MLGWCTLDDFMALEVLCSGQLLTCHLRCCAVQGRATMT